MAKAKYKKTTHEAYNVTKISRDTISKCCKGKYKQAGGYIWKFKEDFMEIED